MLLLVIYYKIVQGGQRQMFEVCVCVCILCVAAWLGTAGGSLLCSSDVSWGKKSYTCKHNFVLYSNCSLTHPSARDAFAFSKQSLKHN